MSSVSKFYGLGSHRKSVLRGLDAVFTAGRNYVIFGGRHSGKTTLLGVLGGTVSVSEGHVSHTGLISPIIGNPGVLATARTAADLIEIYATIYRADRTLFRKFVQEYGDVPGRLAHKPVLKLPPDIRRNLAFALSYGVPAAWYLFDGYVGPSGDGALAKWSARAFEHRKLQGGTIFATSTTRNASRFGDSGGVLHNGRLVLFTELADAIDVFHRIQGINPGPAIASGRSVVHVKKHFSAVTQAKALASSGDVVGAIEFLRTLQAEGPAEIEATYLLARLHEQEGDWDSAIGSARSILGQASSHKGAMVLLARSLEKNGDLGGALEYWKAAAAGSDRSADYLPVFRNYAKQGKWDRALEAVDAARSFDASDSALTALMLRALVELKRFGEFKDLLLSLAASDPPKAVAVLSWTVHRLDVRTLGEVVEAFSVSGLLDQIDALTRERLYTTLERHSRNVVHKGDAAVSELVSDLRNALARLNVTADARHSTGDRRHIR